MATERPRPRAVLDTNICAVAGQATHLVTYDPHFAILGGQRLGIQIVDALGFLAVLRAYPRLPTT